MKFSTHLTPHGYEAKWWLDDDQRTTVRFELPENTIYAWRLAVKKLIKLIPKNSFPDSSSFFACEFLFQMNNEISKKQATLEQVAFCKFLLALGHETSFLEKKFQVLEVFQKHAQIASLSRQWPYHLLFLNSSNDAFLSKKERDEQEWGYRLEEGHRSNPSSELISDLVSHYDLLREFVYQACKEKPELALPIAKNYAALIKAILNFLNIAQQDASSAPATDLFIVLRRLSQKYSPYFYTLVVENETLNLDERQEYLDLIFAHRISYEERSFLLQNVLVDLIEDAQETPDNIIAMETIASLISQYYLKRYALDSAVSVWEQTLRMQQNKRDWLLKALLYLYKYPSYFLVPLVALTSLSFVPIVAPIAVFYSGSLFTAFIASLLLGLWTISTRLLKKQGFSYLELFLPRLFGSIVVGLSILALESTVWEITMDMAWGNWLLMVLAAYTGSLVYLFLDIHKNTRLLSDELGSTDQKDNRRKVRKTSLNAIERSVQTTFKIFAIGLLEAFGLTTLVSSLIPLSALGATFQKLMANGTTLVTWHGIIITALSNNIIVFQLFGPNGLTLNYFPKIIVLWAGLSLLIGAFVQLLWQDRQITAS